MVDPQLLQVWQNAWPQALAAWSRFTQLRNPLFLDHRGAVAQGLAGSFAMIRLDDKRIVVDMDAVVENGVEGFATEILAHEIGHHLIAPATLTDHGRILARMRRGLPTRESQAPLVANLYTDLHINDRLTRRAGLNIPGVYLALSRREGGDGKTWRLYTRICEILWSQERGSLYQKGRAPAGESELKGSAAEKEKGPNELALEGDAQLGARLIRSYSREIVRGSGRFAALLLPYLLADEKPSPAITALSDATQAGAGGEMDGLVEIEADEIDGAIHPSLDPELTGEDSEVGEQADDPTSKAAGYGGGGGKGQAREPFEYGEILKSAGIQVTPEESAIRYYRERSRPHLVPFPQRRMPESEDPLPEGLEPWEMGMPLDEIDWMQSVMVSPLPVPGMTTVKRVWGRSEGAQPKVQPVDLDLYVDSSGSMPDPRHRISYLTLAGAILCLSALRVGARVQCTLWSGKGEVLTTGGFIKDETKILAVLTGYFGGSTTFPLPILRETWAEPRRGRLAHLVQISDDGITTMFDPDEKGNSGWEISAKAMRHAGGGGTMALQIPGNWKSLGAGGKGFCRDLVRAVLEQGWDIHAISDWADLMVFAKAFTRRHYLQGAQ